MIVAPLGAAAVDVRAAEASGLFIRESEINQLLKGDLQLPDSIDGAEDAVISYSVDEKDSQYASIDEENHVLKITRPYAGEGNYTFTLHASVTKAGETVTEDFPLTIAEGVSDDTYAGYIYVSFGDVVNPATGSGYVDVQQVHFFLSEDGLNWTALNGFNPAFLAGKDYLDCVVKSGVNSVNYDVKPSTDVTKTVEGDASVLFPFEGRDQGVRDPYLIRGCKPDGSDSNKVWLLGTDLNTHASQYGSNKATNRLDGEAWGKTATVGIGSTSLFVWETEDWVHWTRRYIDVGSEIEAGMAWAPEAIYNPEKDNYLVYWSARTGADNGARDRLYCNETEDFVHFGPTKLYEQEEFYKKYGTSGRANNSGYGNIDTSQLWVADDAGNPFGTLFRLVKDETNNHIELMSADTVLDPDVDYEASSPINITPYTLGGTLFSSLSDLKNVTGDTNQIKTAEIVYNWFKDESVGNHFTKISQTGIEKYAGAYEGATMFKFIDRDEWCVMIDNYGDMGVRYEPYLTTDLSDPDSIQKAAKGTYGRTGGDIGTHGGMIPITAEEYNTLINTYNADPTVNNYHPIDYIAVDKRPLEDFIADLEDQLGSEDLSDVQKAALKGRIIRGKALAKDDAVSSAEIESFMRFVMEMQNPVKLTVSDTEVELTVGASKTVTAEATPEETELVWNSADESVATVEDGTIKGVSKGSTFVFVKAPAAEGEKGFKGLVPIKVTVN